jgi:hypothetical protein
VEIQWTGWLLDGGVPLILTYSFMMGLACLAAYRIAMSRLLGDLPLFATVILAYDIGVVALTFNYPVFIGSGGLDFWLLNALLFGAFVTTMRQVRMPMRPAQRPALLLADGAAAPLSAPRAASGNSLR